MEISTEYMKKDVPFLVRFDTALMEEINKKADCEGMSAAAIIRMAVRAFLEPKAKVRK